MANKVTNINNCCFIQQFASNSALNYGSAADVDVDVDVDIGVGVAFMQMPFGLSAGILCGFTVGYFDIWLFAGV